MFIQDIQRTWKKVDAMGIIIIAGNIRAVSIARMATFVGVESGVM